MVTLSRGGPRRLKEMMLKTVPGQRSSPAAHAAAPSNRVLVPAESFRLPGSH